MDLEKLANLIYPNVKYTPEELEKKYPERALSKDAYVTRFAPSPTGYLHIGNFFSILMDWQIARMSNGIFYFRLEDTDKKREITGSGIVALNILKEFGIEPFEGLMADGTSKGNYGPYVQSERLDIYHTYAKELIKKGKAFPCFCEKTEGIEEIKQKRKEQLEVDEDITEKDPCRNLSFEQVQKNIEMGKPFAIRLKSQGEKDERIQVTDMIRGTRELAQNSKDIILVKTNGIPPYAFAHAVDDHLMRTRLVIRGEEWFVSLPAHLEVFNALGFEHVQYIHTPIICKIDEQTGNKRKLSKRKDAETDMRYFLSEGFPKLAVMEYLLTLANSNFEIWRLQNPDASFLDFPFSIEKIGNSNPMFDLLKLSDIAKNIIGKMSSEEVYDNLLTYTKEFDQEFYKVLTSQKEYAIKVLSIDRNKDKPRKDFAKWSDFKPFFSYMFGFQSFESLSNYNVENIKIENLQKVLDAYQNVYDETDDKEVWFNKVKQMSGNLGFATDNKAYKANPEAYFGNVADVCNYIRIALTGKQTSPDIHSIAQILGKDEVMNRLQKLSSLINK